MEFCKFKEIINSRLLSVMRYKKLNIPNVVEKSGISQSQIYKILSGDSDTTLVTLHKLILSLDVDVELFFDFSIPPEKTLHYQKNDAENNVLEIVKKNLKTEQANLSRLKGLTQSKIAEKMGYVDYKYINKLLSTKTDSMKDMYLSTLFSIIKQLELEHKIHAIFRNYKGG